MTAETASRTLTDLRALLTDLRAAGWRHRVRWAPPLPSAVDTETGPGYWAHEWHRGEQLVELEVGLDGTLDDHTGIAYGRTRHCGELLPAAGVSVAWVREHTLRQLHRLAEVAGVFDDVGSEDPWQVAAAGAVDFPRPFITLDPQARGVEVSIQPRSVVGAPNIGHTLPVDCPVNADLLRRAAVPLRSPYLGNWDHAVAHAVAELLDQHAKGVDARVEAEQHVAIEPGSIMRDDEVAAVALARALLTSFGLDTTSDRGVHELEGDAR